MELELAAASREEMAGHHFATGVSLANALKWLSYASLGAALVTLPALGLRTSPADPLPSGLFLALSLALFLSVRALSEQERSLAFSRLLLQFGNPRLSLAELLGELTHHLRRRQDSNRCLVLLESTGAEDFLLFRSARGTATSGQRVSRATAVPLLRLSEQHAVLVRTKGRGDRQVGVRLLPDNTPISVDDDAALEIAGLIEASAYICVPLRAGERSIGRIFLSVTNRWGPSIALEGVLNDLNLLSVLLCNHIDQQRSCLQALRRESERLARDLHDGPVQSQVGLKLGLEALVRRIGPDHALHAEMADLMRVSQEGVVDLRAHIDRLRATRTGDVAVPVMREVKLQARRFEALHKIEVRILTPDEALTLRSDLCEQIGLIVREGLCNIKRHTRSTCALVSISAEPTAIRLELLNEGVPTDSKAPLFSPRSIRERAAELGGTVSVASRFSRFTLVTVTLPR